VSSFKAGQGTITGVSTTDKTKIFFTLTDLKKLFNSFSKLKVCVLGDVMLDTYIWGKVDRISPEAPVPIVALDKREYRIGGAGNVALNAQSLGAFVQVVSVTGQDEDAEILKQLLQQKNIGVAYLCNSTQRITTNKTRIISRNQHMMRLDNEVTNDLTQEEEKQLLLKVNELFVADKPDVLIFEDYNKGVLTGNIIKKVTTLCQANGVVVTVDPKRKNFLSYKGVDIFKPNLNEVREALNLLPEKVDVASMQKMHEELANHLQHQISFITLSQHGVFYQQKNDARIIPAHIRSIADVSGAGDTVIAVASLVYAATKNISLSAEVANIAGGLVCEEVGTVAIDKEKLLKECELLLS
jgi:D-glycero-beta-D-manno-heptose-7-phosphate kinase